MSFSADKLYVREYSNFPEMQGRDLNEVDAQFVLALQKFRNKTGIPMLLSPADGALSRTNDGAVNSRHYAKGRLCDAGDFFPDPSRFFECWFAALHSTRFGGIGVYADTRLDDKKRPLIHLDTRPKNGVIPVMWAREKGIYHGIGSSGFYRVLENIKKMVDKA